MTDITYMAIDEYIRYAKSAREKCMENGLPVEILDSKINMYQDMQRIYGASTVGDALHMISHSKIDEGVVESWTKNGVIEGERELEALVKGGYWHELPETEDVERARIRLSLGIVKLILENYGKD